MRWYTLFLLLAVSALTGCLGSEAPLFEEAKASVTFEPRLVGTWEMVIEQRPDELRTVRVTAGENKSYILQEQGKANRIEAHLVDVMGYRFISLAQLPPEEPAEGEAPELDPYYYYAKLEEMVFDDETGKITLPLKVSQNPKFVASFIGRHPEFGVQTRRIEPEENKVGKLILEGDTEALRTAFAALGDTVDGFGAALTVHLTPVDNAKEEEAAE